MVANFIDAPSLYPEIVEAKTPPGRGAHGYYRRRSDGKIITAGAWPAMRNDMEFKGIEYLPQFGTFLMTGPGDNKTEDYTGRMFNVVSEPWRLIFQSPGGADAFPVWQIIAYRWHIRPPYREVKFSQLEGVEVHDFFCPECESGIFSAVEKDEAMEQLRIHLTSRTNEAHSYRPEDLRSLGEELGIDFFAPRRRRGARVAPTIAPAPVLEEPALTPNATARKTCPVCGESVAVAFGYYTKHVKAHEQAGENPDSKGVGLDELPTVQTA